MKPYEPNEVQANAPRFIPTLTEVVEFTPSGAPVNALPEPIDAPTFAATVPSDLLPVTEPATSAPKQALEPANSNANEVDAAVSLKSRHSAEALTEELVHTVMQKVDFVLAERIKEAVSVVIEQQTRTLIPLLREELEFTVRKTIDEATSEAMLEILKQAQP